MNNQKCESEATLNSIDTPCLVLDEVKMQRNIERMKSQLSSFNVILRPHLKTAKSVEVARKAMNDDSGPATVSTLKEAEQFAQAGVLDLIYAVGIDPIKLKRIVALRDSGVDVVVLLDSVEQAAFVVAASKSMNTPIPVLIEIDCDGHRSGVSPDDEERLIAIGQALKSGAELRGVLTHAGGSYDAKNTTELAACAEHERKGAVGAARVLTKAGFPCPVVSIGSTPTALYSRNLSGVTEVRAGVYVFFDLVMAGIGVCRVDEIALSVLTTVIGHQTAKGWILIDAGWMAMSRDRGTANQTIDQGYGIVCDVNGVPIADLIVISANQEHGIIALRTGSDQTFEKLPIGTRLRILPNHACATAAQHDKYHVITNESVCVSAIWDRFSGW